MIIRTKSRPGFTLVEMLIAMGVTVLMMIALARSFGFVGSRVKESRADVELANQLRDFNTLLADELKACTVPLVPATVDKEPLGYFVYQEGPLTDATSSLFRATTDSKGNTLVSDSRYGDLDDYLAFTAVAKGNNWFTGKVPRFVLDQKQAELDGVTYVPANYSGNPWDPVVIRSKYAEIVYFASPEYVASSLPATPQYVDSDGDIDLNGDGDASNNGFPDRIKLHRRVLLIRPDLNLEAGAITGRGFNGIPYLVADAWPTGIKSGFAGGTATLTAAANASDAWLYGMAGVHQQCDLSLRRVLNDNGLPTQSVAANSLADLSKPQNRFGHVRVPGTVLGLGSNVQNSMPLLALGAPATILNATDASAARIAPPLAPSTPGVTSPVVTPAGMSGFIRPEFVLGQDFSHLSTTVDLWSQARVGEDVLLTDVVGFDIRVFDPNAQFVTSSNNLVIGPSDAAYREAIINRMNATHIGQVTQGGFVDLAYPMLAGGPLRGWQARPIHRLSTAASSAISGTMVNFFVSPFSSLKNMSNNNYECFSESMYESGKVFINAGQIQFFQPTYDTGTNYFETDGFRQEEGSIVNRGTRWSSSTTPTTVDEGADGLDQTILGASVPEFGPDDLSELKVPPPVNHRVEGIQISVRLENRGTSQLRQSTVVHRDQF